MIKARHKQTLEKAIKEGKADKPIIPLLEFIASTKNFYTSSSCSGRILLLGIPTNGSKKESFFHAKWHRTIEWKELLEALETPSKGALWFKAEPFILHIGTDCVENANTVLEAMKLTGVKRGGIMLAQKEKVMLELIGTQTISLPVREGTQMLVQEDYLQKVFEIANEKTQKNYEMLAKLEKNFRKMLK
ncbi:MAG: hypothetical protein Q7S21_01005 [archaeon]|nr:hypothetical protein [archaeon]